MQKELTPTEIASMSEVVAKYIEFEFTESNDGTYAYWTNNKDKSCVCDDSDIPDWNIIHEVWEKVMDEKDIPTISDKDLLKSIELYEAVEYAILNGTPIEAFTALYNAIEFINNLKQE